MVTRMMAPPPIGMISSHELTDRQGQVLQFIRWNICHLGYPPTNREIRKEMGIGSANGVACHLQTLVKKGYIKIIPKLSRGIKVLEVDGPTVGPEHLERALALFKTVPVAEIVALISEALATRDEHEATRKATVQDTAEQ